MSAADHDKTAADRAGYGKDARGRRVTLLDPFALRLLRRHDDIPADVLAPIADEVGPGVAKRRYLFFWILPLIVVACFAFLIIRKFVIGTGWRFDPVERVLWPTNIILLGLAVTMMWRSSRRLRMRRVRQVMLKYRRCPHCGYDLRGLPADPTDQATICPECGCAWRLDISGQPSPC